MFFDDKGVSLLMSDVVPARVTMLMFPKVGFNVGTRDAVKRVTNSTV